MGIPGMIMAREKVMRMGMTRHMTMGMGTLTGIKITATAMDMPRVAPQGNCRGSRPRYAA